MTVRGLVDFNFMIKLRRVKEEYSLDVDLGQTQLLEFECNLSGNLCDEVKKMITRDLAKQVFSFTKEGIHDYDLPLALTQLRGFFKLFDEFNSEDINQVYMQANEKFLGVFMNCKAENVDHALSKGVAGADRMDLRFYQNLLDGYGFQHETKLGLN